MSEFDLISMSAGWVITVAGVAVTAWTAILIWAVKAVVSGQLAAERKFFQKQFDQLETNNSNNYDELKRIDEDLKNLRIRLPEEYVRREDWIRFGSVIDAKQDALGEKVGNLALRLEQYMGKAKAVEGEQE